MKREVCHYCRESIAVTRDHIVARTRGGPNAAWNLVPACEPCNQAKADRLSTCWCEKCRAAVARILGFVAAAAPLPADRAC